MMHANGKFLVAKLKRIVEATGARIVLSSSWKHDWEPTNKEAQNEFASCNVYARPDCKDCWAKLYCSGGCAANAYHATGSVRGIYEYGCRLFRKRMECALAVAISRAIEE